MAHALGVTAASSLALPLGITLVVYLIATYILGVWVSGRIETSEDYLVAGRRLPLSLAWATLLATWFGAGTMLSAADEVRDVGLRAVALEPVGAGLCLILAGLFFARRLWQMKLLTLADFFRRRFGRRAELLSAAIMVPGYFGWIAVQFVALAGMLELFFGLDPVIGIALVAAVGMGYTLLGGMWAVTITDAMQVTILLVGLVVLGISVLANLGDGSVTSGFTVIGELPPEMLRPIPTDSARELMGWLGVLCVAALGNLPGQDLMQRIFAARSAGVARTACLLAGGAYIVFGAIPVLMGLAARVHFGADLDTAIVPALADAFLSPPMAIIFSLALTSAVLSTIDSAILSPASVLAENVFPKLAPRATGLQRNRGAVVLVTTASLIVAYLGEDAYSLLELAYEIGLMGLFVPLTLGLFRMPRREAPAVVSMAVGITTWLVHVVAGIDTVFEMPIALPTIAAEAVLYLALDRGPAPSADSLAEP